MCGIIGYTGDKDCYKTLVKGLKSLEYRGYDSCGIAVLNKGKIETEKKEGRVKLLDEEELCGKTGIGHTRWATHGKPSVKNAHPHLTPDGKYTVVHNGIIENAQTLKNELIKLGYKFQSETDTEVICGLLWKFSKDKPLEAISKTVKLLDGSFAIAILCENNEKLFCAKKKSPLIIGKGSNENLIASDINALFGICDSSYRMEDGEIAEISKDEITLYDFDLNKKNAEFISVATSKSTSDKDGFDHYMLKEIYEQPQIFKEILKKRKFGKDIFMPEIDKIKNGKINKVIFCGCGSAYHVGIVGKYLIEEMCNISCEAVIASEFRYKKNVIDEETLFIAISQSGETADTLESLLLAKQEKAKTLGIVNVENSAIAKESDTVIYTEAGTETAVATTKAYTAQLLYTILIALKLYEKNDDYYKNAVECLEQIPQTAKRILENTDKIKSVAKRLSSANDMYFIGRNLDYAAATEAALKLKEISYIHCEAFPAGELKHGTISLIEHGTPVFAVNCRKDVFAKTLSNAIETKSRGAIIFELRTKSNCERESDNIIEIDNIFEPYLPCVQAVALQLVAYYCALEKGCDIDKPRNLAKSVTVE